MTGLGPSAWWAVPARPDRWFGDDELAAAPGDRRALSAAAGAIALSAVLVTLASGLGTLRPLVEIGVVASAIVATRSRRGPAGGVGAEVEPWLRAEVAELAARSGVDAPGIRRSAELRPVASLVGRSPAVVEVSDGLLRADAAVRRWVLAHELAHLRRRDPQRRAAGLVVAAVASAATIEALAALAPGTRPPVAVVAVVVATLLSAWRRRVAERRADAMATALEPVPAEALRPVVAGSSTVLSPGLVSRLFAAHPAPAERLEAAYRNGERSAVVHLPFT